MRPEDEPIGDAALRYAWHGWPIAPGGQPAPPRREGWPVPLTGVLPYRGPMSTNDVVRHWHHRTDAVLLVAGLTIDALEIGPPLAGELLGKLGQQGPVAALPNGCWLVLCEAGEPPPEALLGHTMRYHGRRSWLPLPPTRIGQHLVSWHTDPAAVGWRLVRRHQLDGVLRPTPPPPVPSQQPAPPRSPEPSQQPPSPPDSREPRSRHLTLLVTGDRPRFEVTHVRRGTV